MSYKENEFETSPGTMASSPQPLPSIEHADVSKDSSTRSMVESSKSVAPAEVPKTNWVFCLVFLICGTAQLWYWNSLLNMIFDVALVHFPNYPKLSDTMTAFFGTCNFLVVVLLSWRGGLNFVFIFIAGIILSVISILTPVVVLCTAQEKTAMILMHVLAACAGSATGCLEGGNFALAGSLPRSYTAWVSTGLGISGLLSFSLWMIFSYGAFPNDIGKSLWVTGACGTALMLISTGFAFYFYNRPDVHANIQKMRQQARVERHDPNRLRYVEALKLCWRPLLCILMVFFVSLLMFPAVGPLRWNANSSIQTNVVMGMFQLGDLIGRYIPTLAGKLPWVLLSTTGLFWASGARVLFIVFFVLFWKINNAAFSNVGFQVVVMLLFAITNGWFATVGLVRAPQAIEDTTYKYRGGALGVAALLLGLTLGLWMAKVVTIGG